MPGQGSTHRDTRRWYQAFQVRALPTAPPRVDVHCDEPRCANLAAAVAEYTYTRRCDATPTHRQETLCTEHLAGIHRGWWESQRELDRVHA